MKLKETTKKELSKLAEIMVKKYKVSDLKGTNEFVEYAIFEAKENDLQINWQTIKLRFSWLEMKCDSLLRGGDSFPQQVPFEEEVDEEFAPIPERIPVKVVIWYSDGTKEVVQNKNETIPDKMIAKVPDYTMFVEGEDGLIILKGTNKGKLLHQLDDLNWKGYSKSWSSYMLKEDKNLTEDDRGVLRKLFLGQV